MKSSLYRIDAIIRDNRADELRNMICKYDDDNIYLKAIHSIPSKIDDDDSVPFVGLTLSHVAAYYDSTECLECLMTHHAFADVNIKSANSYTPLHYAILGKARECTLLLLSNGADPNVIPSNTVFSPLFLAARVGDIQIVRMLFDFGAIHTIEKIKQTPVKEALRCKNLECFEILLERGLTVETRNNDFSPLMIAISNNLDDAVSILLDKGHDPNIVSKNGLTALSLACKEKNEEVVRTLLTCSAVNMKTVGAGGTTAIHWAASTCNTSIVSLVIEYGAKIDARTKRGETALAYALRTRPRPEKDTDNHRKDINDLLETLKLLNEKGLTFNEILNDGSCSALEYMMDSSKADISVMNYIFSTGLDINLQTSNATLGDCLYKLRFGKFKDFILEKLNELGYKPKL